MKIFFPNNPKVLALFVVFFLSYSCNKQETGDPLATVSPPSSPTALSRLNPSDAAGSDSTPEITVGGVASGSMVKLFTDSTCSTQVGQQVALGSTVNIIVSSPLSPGFYTFYASASNTAGVSPCSTASISYDYGNPPSSPNSMTLLNPPSASGNDPTPEVTVGGVSGGSTVKLFSDSSCSTQVGQEIVSGTSSDISVNVTVASSLSEGVHNFYSNATNYYGTSACSTVSVSYTFSICPPDFVRIPHDTALGTNSDFCVMKYEAKSNGSGGITTQANGLPLSMYRIGDSMTACKTLGQNYDLISNPEWMTIARNIESVSANWSSGNVGIGQVSVGWAGPDDFSSWQNSSPAPNALSTCKYNISANTCGATGGHRFKRTHSLTNGQEIWDFSGNVGEWVDMSLATGLQLAPTNCGKCNSDLKSAYNVACITNLSLTFDQVFPLTVDGGFAEYLGQFNACNTNGGAASRGGNYNDRSFAGIFSFEANATTLNWGASTGFRCVYRP